MTAGCFPRRAALLALALLALTLLAQPRSAAAQAMASFCRSCGQQEPHTCPYPGSASVYCGKCGQEFNNSSRADQHQGTCPGVPAPTPTPGGTPAPPPGPPPLPPEFVGPIQPADQVGALGRSSDPNAPAKAGDGAPPPSVKQPTQPTAPLTEVLIQRIKAAAAASPARLNRDAAARTDFTGILPAPGEPPKAVGRSTTNFWSQ